MKLVNCVDHVCGSAYSVKYLNLFVSRMLLKPLLMCVFDGFVAMENVCSFVF